MGTLTTRMGLYKSDSSENVDVTKLNDAFDIIDSGSAVTVCTSSTRPASPFTGRTIYETDTGQLLVNTGASASPSWADPVVAGLAVSVTIGASATTTTSLGQINGRRPTTSDYVLQGGLVADTTRRFALKADGALEWGPGGSTARDTNLYRASANTLKTDDSLVVTGSLTVTSTVSASAGMNVGGDLAVTGSVTAGGVGAVQFLQKGTSETRTSTTTIADDNTFSLDLDPGTYLVDCWMHLSGAAAGDFKCAWAFSGTSTQGRACFGPSINTTDVQGTAAAATTVGVNRMSAHNLTTEVPYGLDGAATTIVKEELMIIVTVAGTLKLQWAQRASSGTATTMSTAARLVSRRVA